MKKIEMGNKYTCEGEWQPIETAPKDGSYVMVYPPTWSGVASCAIWELDKYNKKPRPFWKRTDDMGRVYISRGRQPTHWMPLPAPPKGAP